jgi:hypothetical protein
LAAKKRNVSLIPQQDGHARSKKSIINSVEDNDEYDDDGDDQSMSKKKSNIHLNDVVLLILMIYNLRIFSGIELCLVVIYHV